MERYIQKTLLDENKDVKRTTDDLFLNSLFPKKGFYVERYFRRVGGNFGKRTRYYPGAGFQSRL